MIPLKSGIISVQQACRVYSHASPSFCSPLRRPSKDRHLGPRNRHIASRYFKSDQSTSTDVNTDDGQSGKIAQLPHDGSLEQKTGTEHRDSRDGWNTTLEELGEGPPTPRLRSDQSSHDRKLAQEDLIQQIAEHKFEGPIPSAVYGPMINTIRKARELGLPDTGPGYVAETEWTPAASHRPLNVNVMQRQSPIMIHDLIKKRKDPKWLENLLKRKELPVMANGRHKNLIKAIKECDVLIVPGSTGSGKSTQVPQIILDYAIHEGRGGYTNIICSQPRRISAVSVARRVAEERNEPLGQTVGYHVRFSDALPKKYGSILYCTGGILWNYLHYRPGEIMDNASHILIDEVHERSTEIDLILMVLRKLVHERKAQGLKYPKLVLMSATLKSEDFIKYFSEPVDGQPGLRTQTFEIPGRLFPIEETYLDTLLPRLNSDETSAIKPLMVTSEARSYAKQEIERPGAATEEQITRDSFVPPALVAAATIHIFCTTFDKGGDILVFLPGMLDIDRTASLLEANRTFLQNHPDCAGLKILKLHSALSETNDQVFDEIPEGYRRIILSSNIAETSITLSGVTHVIDTGTMKLSIQDTANETRDLRCCWTSRQSVQQRRGRAGRIREGHYYALYSRARLDMFDESVTPEIQRIELTGPALSLKTMARPVDIGSGLCHVPDQPLEQEISSAISRLQRLGALTASQEVTPLGRTLSVFAAKPAAVKAILLGALFRCLEPMIVAAVCDDEPVDGRVSPVGEGQRSSAAGSTLLKSRYAFSQGSGSNSIANHNAFKELRDTIRSGDSERERRLSSERGLRREMYNFVGRSAHQVCEQLHEAGIVNMPEMGSDTFPDIPPELNVNADCQPLVKALLMLSTEPELAIRWSRHTFFGAQGLLMPAFRSVNDYVSNLVHREQIGTRIPERGDIVAYAHGRTVADSRRLAMVETSSVTPLLAVLFARTVEKIGDTHLRLNGAINLDLTAMNDSPTLPLEKAIHLMLEFRKMLDRFLQIAFADLKNGKQKRERPTEGNQMFAVENELRDQLTAGLVEVLNIDAAVENAMLAQRYVVWEERDNARLKQIAKQASAKKLAKLGQRTLRNEGADPYAYARSTPGSVTAEEDQLGEGDEYGPRSHAATA